MTRPVKKWNSPSTLWAKVKPLAQEKRRQSTPAETILWDAVRGRSLAGLKFRRQVPVDRFIVDFVCPDAGLVVEVDGPYHERVAQEDALRQAHLEDLGYVVLRFANDDVLKTLPAVLQAISMTARNRIDNESPPLRGDQAGVECEE